MILLAGGIGDPHISRLASAATKAGKHFGVAWACHDRIGLRIGDDAISINGVPHKPAALFARFNVFGYDVYGDTATWWKYHNWHTAIIDALPSARKLNEHAPPNTKLANLRLAADCGFQVPATAVADAAPFDGICKPLHGGDHTRLVRRGEQSPWGLGFFQEYLPGPEYRIYVVKNQAWQFAVDSPSIDYREKQDATLTVVNMLDNEVACVRRLMEALRLDFAAVDLRCNSRGVLFLEINDGPMFVAFDDLVGRQISAAIIDSLSPRDINERTEV